MLVRHTHTCTHTHTHIYIHTSSSHYDARLSPPQFVQISAGKENCWCEESTAVLLDPGHSQTVLRLLQLNPFLPETRNVSLPWQPHQNNLPLHPRPPTHLTIVLPHISLQFRHTSHYSTPTHLTAVPPHISLQFPHTSHYSSPTHLTTVPTLSLCCVKYNVCR